MRKEPSLVAARHKPHAAVFNAGVLHWKPAVITHFFLNNQFKYIMNTGHEGINFSLTKKKAPSYQASLASRTHLDAKGSQRVSRRLYWKHPSFFITNLMHHFKVVSKNFLVMLSCDHLMSMSKSKTMSSPKSCLARASVLRIVQYCDRIVLA